MGTLRRGTLSLRRAELGPDNPLPPTSTRTDLHAGVTPGGDLPADVRDGLSYGQVRCMLPYSVQDGYRRQLSDSEVPVAVLENDVLRATFLLGYGGRLWSLHRPSGTELLHSPPALRLANLALRNAWFAGGVEWNIGTTGHSPTTCEPLFAARVRGRDGEPVLRMYEYERLRGVVFQIDAWLPNQSQVLFVHVCIRNPADHEVPMYWWSNAAVPESDGSRVIAPADEAYHFGYDKTLRLVPVPHDEGEDLSYTTRSPEAADHFFRIPRRARPWIAALDAEGTGLVQTSTGRLRGRKLFRWGVGTGGQHWQEWLGEPGRRYLEIQAGLAPTQLEHLRMPPLARWSWVEAYGLLTADPGAVHGGWAEARRSVERALEELVPIDRMDAALEQATLHRDAPPEDVLSLGSGWGALEEERRAAAGEPSMATAGTPFPAESLRQPQAAWIELLRAGELPDTDQAISPVLGQDWAQRLRRARSSWQSELQLAYLARAAGDDEGARERCHRSLERRRTVEALRLSAALLADQGQRAAAAEQYLAAHELDPGLRPLALEAGHALVAAGQPADALRVVEALAPEERSHGRVLLLEATAAAAAGDTSRARRIFREGLVVDDIREGDDALGELWQAAFPGESLPRAYDFRMWAGPREPVTVDGAATATPPPASGSSSPT